MDKAKVYFTDFRVPVGRNIMQKLRALCLAAGIKKICLLYTSDAADE